jgi:hypothetical protein
MTESAPRPDPPGLSSVPDPDVRRALRTMYHDLHQTIEKHQLEIQALLEMMLEKHVGSIGEYKRHLTRLQQGGVPRSERIQGQIGSATAPHGTSPRDRLGGH